MNRIMNRTGRNRAGEGVYDDDTFKSVASMLNSFKRPDTAVVVDKRQVIMNKAFAMTAHKQITNGKEFKQVVSVVREVKTVNRNLAVVKDKQLNSVLVVAPKGFFSHMNKLIDACNYYIANTPLLELGNIKKIEYLDETIDLKGVQFYDRKGLSSLSSWTEEEDMVGYINSVKKEAVTPSKLVTHQLEDIL